MDLGLTYTKIGDYYYPDIALPDTAKYHIGLYGRRHERYLKEHRPVIWGQLPHLTYQQFRTVQRLVHECCNNVDGDCLLLDNGWETCTCVQSISRSLVCKYFRAAVLPLDRELETALFYKKDSKHCCRCGALFRPRSNRGKYCPDCAVIVHRQQKAESERRRRAERGQLGA